MIYKTQTMKLTNVSLYLILLFFSLGFLWPAIAWANDIVIDSPVDLTGDQTYEATGSITVNANVTVTSGNLTFTADSDQDGTGTFTQAASTEIKTVTSGHITIYSSGDAQVGKLTSINNIYVYDTQSADANITLIDSICSGLDKDIYLYANGNVDIQEGVYGNSHASPGNAYYVYLWADYDSDGQGAVTRTTGKTFKNRGFYLHTASDIYLGGVVGQNNYWDDMTTTYGTVFYATSGHNITVGPSGYAPVLPGGGLELYADNDITVNGDTWSTVRTYMYADYDQDGNGDFIHQSGRIASERRPILIRGNNVQLGHIEGAASTGYDRNIEVTASYGGAAGNVTCNSCDLRGSTLDITNNMGSIGTPDAPLVAINGLFRLTASAGVHIEKASGDIDFTTKDGNKVTDTAGDYADYGTDLTIKTTGDITNSGDITLHGGTIKLYANSIGTSDHPIIPDGSALDLTATGGSVYTLPLPPTLGSPSNITSSSIRWNFTGKSPTYETGFRLYDDSDTLIASSPINTTTYLDETGLSENALCSGRYVKAYSTVGESLAAAFSASYTLVDAPTNLTATANSHSITLSVDAFPNDTSGSSGYYFYRQNGPNSGWIQSSSWQDTGLASGNLYTYAAKYRNGDGVETGSVSLTASTSGGGGLPPAAFNPPTPPGPTPGNPGGGFNLSIDNNAQSTSNRRVTLNLRAGPDAKKMAISEDPDFGYASQEPFQSNKIWTLSQGDGEKTIYAKFFTEYGYPSEVISQTIVLDTGNAYSRPGPQDSDQQFTKMMNEATEVVKSTPEAFAERVGVEREVTKEQDVVRRYLQPLARGTNLTVEIQTTMTSFIAYGTQTTQRLGAGERAGVLHSFQNAFGRLPTSQTDWEDVMKISNGRWPKQTLPEKEAEAAGLFESVYLREPDRTDPHDDAAVVVMTYGLRPANRNLDSEKAAIRSFVHIFKKIPNTVTDWTVVKAIAYSGATR